MRRAIAAAALLAAACNPNDGARQAIEAAGYSDVSERSNQPWLCDADDIAHVSFLAIDARHRRVAGVACAGYGRTGKEWRVRILGTLSSASAAR